MIVVSRKLTWLAVAFGVMVVGGFFNSSDLSVRAAEATVCTGNFTRDLRLGMAGADVKQLQQYLNGSSFPVALSGVGAVGRETTYFGTLTKLAVVKLQTANNLVADGIFDGELRNYLGCITPPVVKFVFTRDLRLGMTHGDVRELQKYLNNNGFPVATTGYGSVGRETTYFGRLTQVALRRFQEQNLQTRLDATQLNREVGNLYLATRQFINGTNAGEFTITYVAGANGTLTGNLTQKIGWTGNGSLVTAVPNAGYEFESWSDGLTINPRTDANLTANTTVIANFRLATPAYILTYLAGANGSLVGTTVQTVKLNGSGTAVTAKPNASYQFVNWSDGSTANPRIDTDVTTSKTRTANFSRSFTLRYLTSDAGTLVGATVQTVNAGGSGTEVLAQPSIYYRFAEWSDGRTDNPRIDAYVTTDRTVTAIFVPVSGGSGAVVELSSNKEITAFTIAGQAGDTTIDSESEFKEITLTMPYQTDVTALVATFTITGASVNIGGVNQVSGVTAVDHTSGEVIYTVVAEDGSTVDYHVYVSVDTPQFFVRGLGQAGGRIFYDKGFQSDGWRYLEAAPADAGTASWGTQGTDLAGADGTALGTGVQNTADIVANDPLSNTAADMANDYLCWRNDSLFEDWFLPSKDELDLMFTELASYDLGSFNRDGSAYWSSTEAANDPANFGFQEDMLEGFQSAGWKSQNPQLVRAIQRY